MKRILSLLTLASISAASMAQANTAMVDTLRGECAAKNPVKQDKKAHAANEFVFVYHKGEYRGEQVAGKPLHCSESQYAAYLNTVDPSRVMTAYPTAAGRPTVKTK